MCNPLINIRRKFKILIRDNVHVIPQNPNKPSENALAASRDRCRLV